MNELELFEAYMKKEHPFIDTVNGAYEAMWNLWQARVPEGYAVVPVEINDEIESAMFSSVARGEMPCDIYKAMIEAVEK